MITSLPTKCISAISQWQTFLKSFTHKMAANATLRQNYVTVTLCIGARRLKRLQFFVGLLLLPTNAIIHIEKSIRSNQMIS